MDWYPVAQNLKSMYSTTTRVFPYLSRVGKSSVERSANVFHVPTEIPLKIENMITLRVSAVMATLSGGMRRRKSDKAERDRLIAAGKAEEGREEEGDREGR